MSRPHQYKIRVDQELLTQFLLSDTEPTQEQIEEVNKVFRIIIIKYYSEYAEYADDLVQYAYLAVLERRSRYDPSFSAYNYIYTIFRNEVGNRIKKMTKETLVEDITTLKHRSSEEYRAELPPEVERYKEYLTGEKEFNIIRIPQKDVLNIILFLRLHESRRDTQIPDFIKENSNSTKVLYKLLKELADL